MSVKFKKLAIAAAVGVTLGAAGSAQANGNTLLFPYITTSATAFSFITVFHDPVTVANMPAGAPPHAARAHHLYYGYKPVGAAATDACVHLDFPVNVTQGALLQFEAGGKFNLVADFGDPAGYGASLVLANNQLPNNVEGFLIVENTNADAFVATERRRGEAAIVDTSTGLALAYSAVSDDNDADGVNPDFAASITDTEYVSSWYPRNIVTTTWYALPVGPRVAMTPNAGGGLRASIRPETNTANIGAFARAEHYTSGSKVNNLRCFGTFGIDQLLNAQFADGGWMSITATVQNSEYSNAMVDGGDQEFALWKMQNVPTELGSPVMFVNEAIAR